MGRADPAAVVPEDLIERFLTVPVRGVRRVVPRPGTPSSPCLCEVLSSGGSLPGAPL